MIRIINYELKIREVMLGYKINIFDLDTGIEHNLHPRLIGIDWSLSQFENLCREQFGIYSKGLTMVFFNKEDALQMVEWLNNFKVMHKLSKKY